MAETINMVNQQIERSAAANGEQSYERRCASYIDAGRGADTDANLVGCSEVARDQATTTHTTGSLWNILALMMLAHLETHEQHGLLG